MRAIAIWERKEKKKTYGLHGKPLTARIVQTFLVPDSFWLDRFMVALDGFWMAVFLFLLLSRVIPAPGSHLFASFLAGSAWLFLEGFRWFSLWSIFGPPLWFRSATPGQIRTSGLFWSCLSGSVPVFPAIPVASLKLGQFQSFFLFARISLVLGI